MAVREHFNKIARKYNEEAHKGFFRSVRTEEKEAINDLLQEIPKDKIFSILEFGCGAGFYTRQLREIFPKAKIVAIDISENMLAQNKAPFCEFICADMEEYAPDFKVDLLFAAGSLEFTKNPFFLLKRSKNFLAHGGYFCLMVPSSNFSGTIYKIYHFMHRVRVRVLKKEKIIQSLEMNPIFSKKIFPFSEVLLFRN